MGDTKKQKRRRRWAEETAKWLPGSPVAKRMIQHDLAIVRRTDKKKGYTGRNPE